MQIKLFLASLSAFAISGCGGSSSESNEPAAPISAEQTYTLKVMPSDSVAGLELSWMNNTATLVAGNELDFTAKGTSFVQPVVSNIPDTMNCDSTLSNTTSLDYTLSIECAAAAVTFELTTPYLYPIIIRYAQSELIVDKSTVSTDASMAGEVEIMQLGGPQICDVEKLSNVKYEIACHPYITVSENEKVYLHFGGQDKQLLFDNPNKERLLASENMWFEEKIWFITQSDASGFRLQSVSFDNGQLGDRVVYDITPSSIARSGDTLFALSSSPIGLYRWKSGAWQMVSNLLEETTLQSGFVTNNSNLYLAAEDNDDPASKSYIQIINGQVRGKKAISNQISQFSHAPLFDYDDVTFSIGFGRDDQLIINVMDSLSSARDDAIFSLVNVKNATIWQNKNNQFLFTNNDSGVEQFEFSRNDVQSTIAFDINPLTQLLPDWIGGDLDTLLAGDFVDTESAEHGVLKYLRHGDVELFEAQLQTRLNTTYPIRVYNETWQEVPRFANSNTTKITPIVSEQGFILVYVGAIASPQSQGQLWALSAGHALLIKEQVLWGQYLSKNYHFEAISQSHLVVFSKEENEVFTVAID